MRLTGGMGISEMEENLFQYYRKAVVWMPLCSTGLFLFFRHSLMGMGKCVV